MKEQERMCAIYFEAIYFDALILLAILASTYLSS